MSHSYISMERWVYARPSLDRPRISAIGRELEKEKRRGCIGPGVLVVAEGKG